MDKAAARNNGKVPGMVIKPIQLFLFISDHFANIVLIQNSKEY